MLTRRRAALSFLALAVSLAPARAEKGVPVASAFPGEVTLQYLAPAGVIRQGEVVAVLDCTAISSKLKAIQKQLSEAEKAHVVAREQLEVMRAIHAEKEANAAEAIEAAERNLAKYRENDAPGIEVALKLGLHDAETEFKKQEERFESRDHLLAEGFIQKVEYDNEEVRLKRAKLALEAAKLKMSAFNKYEREAREGELKQAIRKARERKQTLEADHATNLRELIGSAETAEADMVRLKAQEEKLTTLMNQTIVRAAKAGRFTPDTDHAERGTVVANGQVLGAITGE